jgi:hypothetical protein
MDFKGIRDMVVNKVSEKSPEILIGLGLAGMLTSTVLAVKATPKALDIIREEEEYKKEALTRLQKVKLTWKYYAPAAIGYCTSAACILGANSVNAKRNAVLASAYKITENALLEYKDKVVEVLGEEKEREIRDSIAEDRIQQDVKIANNVLVAGKGGTLCYDMYSGRYFNSDMDKISKILNQINYKLMADNMISLNDFYYELGMDSTANGYDFGWNVDDGLIEIYFSSILSEDGTPCLAMHFDNMPKIGFDRMR